MKKVTSLLLALLLTASLGACTAKDPAPSTPAPSASASDAAPAGEQPTDGKKVDKMVIVLPNVRGDGGTHDLACRAAEKIAADTGAELKVVELGKGVTDLTKWVAALADLCEEDWDVIITGGSLMKDTIMEVAPNYPDMPIICYDVRLEFDKAEMPNVYSMDFYQNEAAFMAGAVAASMSKTGYIGYIGATQIPIIYDFMVGYIAGAQEVNPDIKVATAFTGDFNDAARAQELAITQIKAGADVLFPACGNGASGVYLAAKDQKVFAVGNDLDVAEKYAGSDPEISNIILASTMKKVDFAVARAFDMFVAGTLPFGTQETVGVKEESAGLVKTADYEKQIPEEVRAKMTEIEGKISSGEIKVPTAIGKTQEEIQAVIDSAK